MEDNIKKELLNASGKRMLMNTKLNYSKSIIDILKSNPFILNEILEEMDLSYDEFFSYLSLDVDVNIVIYDQALVLARKKSKK